MTKETAQKFILDPEWKQFEDFILSFFEHETDIKNIDINRDSSTIHAEVIARQKIAEDIQKLKYTLESLGAKSDTQKPRFI